MKNIIALSRAKIYELLGNIDEYLNRFDRIVILEPTIAHLPKNRPKNYLIDFGRNRGVRWDSFDVILTTYERGDHVLLFNDELARNSLIVIDNAYFLTIKATPVVSILGNHRDKAKFMLISPAIPDVDRLKRYLRADVLKRSVSVQIHDSLDFLSYLKPSIVFVPTKRLCNVLAKSLGGLPFHSGLDLRARRRALRMFKDGKVKFLISTLGLAYRSISADRVVVVMGDNFRAVDLAQMIGMAKNEAHVIISSDDHYSTVRRALRGEFESITVDDVESLLLRLVKARRVGNVYEVRGRYIGVDDVTGPLNNLIRWGLMYPDMRLTRAGHVLAKYYLPVREFIKIRPLIPKKASVHDLARVLGVRISGRTLDKLERFSLLLYELSRRKDWLRLSQRLHIAKLVAKKGSGRSLFN